MNVSVLCNCVVSFQLASEGSRECFRVSLVSDLVFLGFAGLQDYTVKGSGSLGFLWVLG